MTQFVECPMCCGTGYFICDECPLCGGEATITTTLDSAYRLLFIGSGSEALTTIKLFEYTPKLFSLNARTRLKYLLVEESNLNGR